jgi:hypothetical protein
MGFFEDFRLGFQIYPMGYWRGTKYVGLYLMNKGPMQSFKLDFSLFMLDGDGQRVAELVCPDVTMESDDDEGGWGSEVYCHRSEIEGSESKVNGYRLPCSTIYHFILVQ